MGTNWPWNWRLTVLKIMMTLSGPPATDFKMTVRADCAGSACRPLLLSESSCPLTVIEEWGSQLLDRHLSSPPPSQLPTSKIKQVSFPSTWPLYRLWEVSSLAPLSVTAPSQCICKKRYAGDWTWVSPSLSPVEEYCPASLTPVNHSHFPRGPEISYLHPGRQLQYFVSNHNRMLSGDLGFP